MKINKVMSEIRAIYLDWDHVLVNPQFIRNNNQVTWPGCSHKFFSTPILLSDVQLLEREKQFSFQVIDDGAIIQLNYTFHYSSGQLVQATLAYFGTTIILEKPDVGGYPGESTIMSDDGESIDQGILPSDITSGFDDGPVGWMRFDFHPPSERGILHHSCHLHLPLFPDARLVVDRVPSPRQFIEWIIALCYSSHYSNKRLDHSWGPINFNLMKKLNAACFSPVSSNIYELVPHLRMPR